MTDMYEKITELARNLSGETIKLRRYFHEHPEVSWEERATTDAIKAELESIGVDVIRVGYGVASTGLSAEIRGGDAGRCVALRADIDALPIREETGAPYESQNVGAMHACGHDSHIAMLLSAAKILKDIAPNLRGSVRLLFQPAEEHGAVSGAEAMVAAGALDGVDAALGLHIFTSHRSGAVCFHSGPFMPASDKWEIAIVGHGGHGAIPESTIDPTPAAAAAISALHTIVSREIPPRDTAVVSVGGIRTSSFAYNIIPDRVELCGTSRTFTPDTRRAVEAAIRRIAASASSSYRCDAEISYESGPPSVVNDPATTAFAADVARAVFGEDAIEIGQFTCSEDFSYIAQAVPATFVVLGSRRDEATSYPQHSPKFDIDESVLWRGAAMHAAFAWKFLQDAGTSK